MSVDSCPARFISSRVIGLGLVSQGRFNTAAPQHFGGPRRFVLREDPPNPSKGRSRSLEMPVVRLVVAGSMTAHVSRSLKAATGKARQKPPLRGRDDESKH